MGRSQSCKVCKFGKALILSILFVTITQICPVLVNPEAYISSQGVVQGKNTQSRGDTQSSNMPLSVMLLLYTEKLTTAAPDIGRKTLIVFSQLSLLQLVYCVLFRDMKCSPQKRRFFFVKAPEWITICSMLCKSKYNNTAFWISVDCSCISCTLDIS